MVDPRAVALGDEMGGQEEKYHYHIFRQSGRCTHLHPSPRPPPSPCGSSSPVPRTQPFLVPCSLGSTESSRVHNTVSVLYKFLYM